MGMLSIHSSTLIHRAISLIAINVEKQPSHIVANVMSQLEGCLNLPQLLSSTEFLVIVSIAGSLSIGSKLDLERQKNLLTS